MTDKTEAQPEALRLAANLRRMNMLTINCMELERAANELEKAHTEIDRLRALAATCYAGLGGECDLPVIWLDALNDAANGEPFDADGLLPYTSATRAQLVAQTNRAAAAEQQVTALTQRLDTANALNTEARNQLARQSLEASPTAVQWKVGDEFLPYHLDASHVDPAYRDGWNHCYQAAQLSQAHVAPDGWKLVPIHPTDEMIAAAHESDRVYSQRAFGGAMHMPQGGEDHWSAMLAASPTPPARKGLSDAQIEAIITKGGGWWADKSYWRIEDADLHPIARALIHHGIQGDGN